MGSASLRPRLAPVAGGLVAGVVAGLFGVGGGILLVPLLVLVLGRDQHTAHATSLVAVTLAAVAGVVRFGVDGSVAWTGAVAVAVGAVTGAWLGARWMAGITARRLRQGFAVLLLLTALRFLLAGNGGEGGGSAVPDLDATLVALHALGGVAAGMTSSLLGVGGGIINVPLLVIGFGYGQQVAEGTSLAVIVPTALMGALSHSRNSFTEWGLGATIGGGAAAGSVLGASVALSIPEAVLSRLFGGLAAVVGLLMLRRSGRSA